MKTAISIPDDLFKGGEAYARELGISRSELYARALSRLLKEKRAAEIKDKINEVCEKVDTRLDPFITHLHTLTLPPEKW